MSSIARRTAVSRPRASARRPEFVAPHAVEGLGVAVTWLVSGASVALSHWRCLCDHAGLSGTKQQAHHVVAFIHRGAFALRNSHGKALIDANWMALYNPGEEYQTAHPAGCGDEGTALSMTPSLFAECLEEIGAPGRSTKARFHLAGAPLPADIFWRQQRLLRAAEEGEPESGAALQSETLALLARCLTTVFDRPLPRLPPRLALERTEAVIELLHQRFHEPVRLADLAAHVGVTPWHLCRSFKQAAGVSLHAYLNSLRLREATRVLRSRPRSLTRIAHDLGYSSHSHFSTAFRSAFGCSPSQWRDGAPDP